MKLVITGTPATGKTTLAREISKETGWPVVEINALVKSDGLGRKNKAGEIEVEPAELEEALGKELKGRRDYVVEGHLACECRIPADAVVVLRCDPLKLRQRYAKRRYSAAKTKENMLAEALDYCLVRAEVCYGRGMVLQIDATSKKTAGEVLKAAAEWNNGRVNWMAQMRPGGRLGFLLRERV